MQRTEFLIVGGGIAGASVGWWLAPHGRTVLLERESQPGYHSTGRSAALFSETYGTAQVRALSRASRAFLERPPEGFAESPLLAPRGALMIGDPQRPDQTDVAWGQLAAHSSRLRRLSPAQACAHVPVLRPERTGEALLEPDAADLDVHALHQGFLRGMRRAGASIECGAAVESIGRDGAGWRVQAADGREWRADVLVDAAGAWADRIAIAAGVRPIGLQPRRRSAFVFAPPAGLEVRDWPLAIALDESWYIKPDAGLLLGSPANADPVEPQDVQPEEWDVAVGIDRIQRATTLEIRRPLRAWAGLRSFVADGDLVGGPAPDAPGFVWVAAQGGYGIQTCAAMGEACAALARGLPLPARLQDFGLDAAMLSPARASLGVAPVTPRGASD